MAKPAIDLVPSELAAVKELRQRLSIAGRAPTLVLAGPLDNRLALVLQQLSDLLGGSCLDLATPAVFEDLRTGPPLYGREPQGRLTATVMRQFLLRKVNELGRTVLAVRVPSVIWKIIAASEADGQRRLLGGLREWASPCGVVLSYPLEADASSLSTEELQDLLAYHLVALTLTPAERRYLEPAWEGTAHDEQ